MSGGDDFLDDFRARLERRIQQHVDAEFVRLTSTLDTSATDQPCPMPLEWHPFYADKTWLVDWLNGTGRFRDLHVVQLPKVSRHTWVLDATETAPSRTAVPMERITLTKGKCWGPAPFVGRPFNYVWPVAIDNHGRGIAGEAKMHYMISDAEWFMRGYE